MIKNSPIGLYIHIPFCNGKCPYCDFYSFVPKQEIIDKYVSKLCFDVKSTDCSFDTVYLGGGTPSCIGTDKIVEILRNINFTNDAEITVECNPSNIGSNDKEYDFLALAHAGVNRISMGLQSADNTERKLLGRKAGCDEVLRGIERAYNAGITNISLDLMLGIPNQTEESLIKSIEFCVKNGAKHISAYILKLEEGTYFFKNRNKYNFPDEDTVSNFYLLTSQLLSKQNYSHYEISNFCLDGYESKHNLKYWQGEDYLGIGPSAHSFLGKKRYHYESNIDDYINNATPVYDGEGGDLEETILLSLRLSTGLNFQKLYQRYNYIPSEAFIIKCKYFENIGLANYSEDSFSLTPKGFLLSNSIIVDLIELL